MKKLLIAFLLFASAISTKAQTNYLLPGGVPGIRLAFHSPHALNMTKADTSRTVTAETYWFKNNDAGFGTVWTVPVDAIFTNLTANWVKISCYDFTKTTLVRTINVSPNNTVYFNYDDANALMSTSKYYWKFENITSQSPVLVADNRYCQAYSTVNFDVLGNDLNMQSSWVVRVKPGQTLTGFQVLQTYGSGFQIKAGANPGVYSLVYEVMNGSTIIGEKTSTVTVAAGEDYCTLNITDIVRTSLTANTYDVTLASPDAGINPFNYRVQKISDGTIVKQGVTPPADDNKETIDLTGVPTGYYRVIFESSTKICLALFDISHVLAAERCSISIPSVDKVPGTNTYKVNVLLSGTSSYKYSSNLNSISGVGQTATSFSFNLDGVTSATYSITVDGEGKTCSASADIIHFLSSVPTGAERIETYVKLLANYKDNWTIAGTNTKGGNRDYDTQSRSAETASSVNWQSYISDFQNVSNAANAFASIGLQKDTARNEPNLSILVTPSKLILQQRLTKNGTTNILQTLDNVTMPLWLRLRKVGNNVTAEYSKTASMNPIWTTIAIVQNVTNTWNKTYYKTLGVGSTSSNYIAEARFRGQLGGQINFVSQTPNPPVISSVPANPVAGNNVVFSATGCAGGISWFAGSVNVASTNTLSIANVVANTNYTAKCTVNSKVSAASNAILIDLNTGLPLCKNGNAFEISTITATSTANTYSVAFNALNLTTARVHIKNSGGILQKTALINIAQNTATVDVGQLVGGTYTMEVVGTSCTGTASKTFTVINNNTSCINGSSFDILSVTQSGSTSSYTIQFNANSLANVNVVVKDANNLNIRDFNQSVTANPVVVDLGSLSGVYTLYFNGISCQGQTSKIFTAVGSIAAPTISSNPNPAIAGTNVTLTATNCSYTVDWYKNGTYVSSGASLAINSAILNDIYAAKCKNGTNASGFSSQIVIGEVIVNGSGVVNTLADITIPVTTKWNYFDPDIIPNFTPAKSIDAKTGQNLPNKWFIWHAPYRNLFGIDDSELSRLTKMTNKGVTAWNMSKLPAYTSAYASVVTPERLVTENYGLGINNGNPHPEEANYTNWINWAKGGVINASGFGITPINGKYGQLLTISDYENLHTNLTTQIASNYHTVALNSMANIATGRVGFQYGLGLNTLGYYTSNLYTGSNNVWANPADNSVPTEFIGKSSASSNRIVGVNEITYAYEAFLPEDYLVKDQNNNDWFRIKHFGAELDNTYNGGNLAGCNAQHWATNIGVGTETAYNIHKTYPNGGQDLIIQLKPVNETDNGFHYDQRYAQYRNNKYANYVNRFGITNVRDIYDNNGNKTGTEEFLAPTGSEYVTNLIAEGQIMLAYFSGAKAINWWSSDFTDVAIPKDKAGNTQRGAKYNDINYGNRDLDAYIYTLKALWRLNQKINLGNGSSYSFNEICDGTEIYLNQSTKVVYPGSTNVTQLRALDWQLLKKSPVRAVVNVAKNVVFVIALQAYGVEDNIVTFKLTDYGANISQDISIPAGKIIVKAFPLTGVISEGTSVIAPSITKDVANPTNNQSVTFTSSGCQSSAYTNKWYDSAEGNMLQTGITYTVNAVNGNGYYAKCVGTSASSAASNIITFSIASSTGVTITEPAKPAYHFSDGHPASYYDNNAHSPAIFTNAHDYSPTNDLVWMRNDKVKIGIHLGRGGQIAWASLVNETSNLVYNGYDGGFQVQMDAYQKKDGYEQNGKYSRAQFDAQYQYSNSTTAPAPNNLTSYNVTQGGDFLNNAVTLIDYHPVGSDGYYVKVRPNFYTLNSELSQTYIEVWYKLEGYALKIDYKYTSFRTDGQYDGGGFDGGHAPVCFLVNNLTRYKSYTGNSPWTRSNKYDNEDGILPNETTGQSTSGTPLTKHSKERWSLVYNPDNSKTIGVYANTNEAEESFGLKQKDIYDGNGARNGGEFNGGYTILGRNYDLVPLFQNFDRSNFTKTISSYLIVTPNPNTFVDTVYQISGH